MISYYNYDTTWIGFLILQIMEFQLLQGSTAAGLKFITTLQFDNSGLNQLKYLEIPSVGWLFI